MIPAEPHARAAAVAAPTEPTFEESVDLDYESMPPKASILPASLRNAATG